MKSKFINKIKKQFTIDKVENLQSKETPFIIDKPLSENDIDEFGYENYAQTIANKIKASEFDIAYTIGINAKWGAGKTSFMNLIKRNFDKNKYIQIDFSPWFSKSSEAIIQDFFETFEEELSKYHSSIAKDIRKYSKKLANIEELKYLKIFHSIWDLFFPEPTTKELFEEINAQLEQIDRKIIFYIDDLDRLDKKEVVEVLKLIRNSASFRNTFFVVSYDKNYLISAIKEFNDSNPENFLEKIINIEIQLPYYSPNILKNKLLVYFSENYNSLYHKYIENEIDNLLLVEFDFEFNANVPIKHNLFFSDWITNFRDLKMLLNSISIFYHHRRHDIVFYQMLLLEMLKLKYPIAYNLLKLNQLKYLKKQYLNNSYKIILTLKPWKSDNKKELKQVKFEIIMELSNKYDISNEKLYEIQLLIEKLFQVDLTLKSEYENLSIYYPSNFELYFDFKHEHNNRINENQFNSFREKQKIDNMKSTISEWIQNDLTSNLLKRFYVIDIFKNNLDFLFIIMAISFLANQKQKENPSLFIGYDQNDFIQKIINFLSTMNNEKEKLSIVNIFKRLLIKVEQPYYFEALILRHLHYNYNSLLDGLKINFTRDEIEKILSNYLEQYCKSIKIFDENLWHLMWSCYSTYYNEERQMTLERFFPKVVDKIVDFISINESKLFFIKLIKSQPHLRNENYFNLDHETIEKLFASTIGIPSIASKESKNKFINLVKEKINTEIINKEFYIEYLEFVNKIYDPKNIEFQVVEFKFNTFSINNWKTIS